MIFLTATLYLEIQKRIYIFVFSLPSKFEISFMKFCQHLAEMSPFFGNNWRQFDHEFIFITVPLDQGYAGRSRFLFTIGVVGKNIFQGFPCKVDPARIGRELKAEDVFGILRKFHPANVGCRVLNEITDDY